MWGTASPTAGKEMGEVVHNTNLLIEIMAAYVDGAHNAQAMDGLGSIGLARSGSDTV